MSKASSTRKGRAFLSASPKTRKSHSTPALIQGQPVSDTELSEAAFSRDIDSLVRQSLEKHIDNIRGKIEHLGLSVYRLRRYGYVLTISSD